MTKERKFICVSCPLGCGLTVALDGDAIVNVSGNSCPRGKTYAESEVKNPCRVFASTVRVRGGRLPVCPVRSRTPAPRGKLLDIARAVAKLEVPAPIAIGQTILKGAGGTDVDIVASRDLSAL